MHIQLPAEAPIALRALTDSVLVLHIGGGIAGIAAGGIALTVRKGAQAHRAAGTAFCAAMLVAYGLGAAAAPFVHQPANVIGGIFASYLVITAWMAVRRPPGRAGAFDVAAAVISLATAVAMAGFAWFGANSPRGLIDGVPFQAAVIVSVFAAFAGSLDLRVVLKGGLSGADRIARHLWRMCAALFAGAASFFIGQPQVFPPPLRGSPLLFLPPLAVLAAMVFWLWRVRRQTTRRIPAPAAAPA